MRDYLEVWCRPRTELMALDAGRITIGRRPENDIAIAGDLTVSKLHAVIEQYGGSWCIRDVGSANGTYLNGKRLVGEHRLSAGDEILVGETRLVFRSGRADLVSTTSTDGPPVLTRREQEVLVALCRPLAGEGVFAQPATVQELAAQLVVSEAAVKFHLANLYDKFDIGATIPCRRLQLANEAVRRRAVSLADLRSAS